MIVTTETKYELSQYEIRKAIRRFILNTQKIDGEIDENDIIIKFTADEVQEFSAYWIDKSSK